MNNSSAVNDDIVKYVGSKHGLTNEQLASALVRSGGPTTKTESDCVQACYELQRLRNDMESQLEQAADSDAYKLIDDGGYVFWVDIYDGFGAYIHAGDSDTYYVSLQQLEDFLIVEA